MRDQFPGVCFAMAGLHPGSVKENYKEELEFLDKCLEKDTFTGIGETGIDLYWDKTFQKEQEESFVFQIQLALKYDLPIVIHARESFNEIFKILDSNFDKQLKGVFHSFTGGQREAEKINEYGFYFGINGIVTYKNAGIDLTNIPLDRLLLETDSPFLAPVPKRGRRNESEYIMFVASKVAELYQVSTEEIAGITTANALRLFKI
jgi:TatD DNase family protein